MRGVTTKTRKTVALSHACAGVFLAAASLWAFLYIADEIPERGALVRRDLAVAAYFQRGESEHAESAFAAVSLLGSSVLVALVLAVVATLASRRDYVRSASMAIVCGSGALLNYALKALFHRGRPEYASEFIHGPSWSFPSGHATNSLVCYGFLTFLLIRGLRKRWSRKAVVAGAAALIVSVGFSRIYLGVHYLSDVIGGFLVGTVWLMVCTRAFAAIVGKPAAEGEERLAPARLTRNVN